MPSRAQGGLALTLLLLGAAVVPGLAAASATGTSTVMAWGANYDGQLGDGTTTQREVPVSVKVPKGIVVKKVAAGAGGGLALTSTGSVLAWGYNGAGQLGDGNTHQSDIPVRVKLPKGVVVTAVAAGGGHSLAVTSGGSVLAWGGNLYGELGDGSTTNSDVPVTVKLPKGTKVTAVAAGNNHSLALTSTGAVLAWGENTNGELGRTSSQTCASGTALCSPTPAKVKLPQGTKVTAITAGLVHSLALTSTGSLLAWGDNRVGELGDGSTIPQSSVPVKVKLPQGTKVTQVAGSGGGALAATSTGSVLAWGDNFWGALGDGTSTGPESCGGRWCSRTPVKVKLPKGAKVSSVAGGAEHALALTSTGSVLAWGQNVYGQLGDASTDNNTNLPVRVTLPPGTIATEVSASPEGYHSLALVHHT